MNWFGGGLVNILIYGIFGSRGSDEGNSILTENSNDILTENSLDLLIE